MTDPILPTNDDILDLDYDLLIEHMVNGFALHKIVLDDKGQPIDYIFIKVNESFEKLTNLKREDIINKKISEVLPGTADDPANWIGRYGEVAKGGVGIQFENFSQDVGKWFLVSAYSPQKGYFVTTFIDITARKKLEEELKEKIRELELFQQATVSRELKMVEMKDKIADLEKKVDHD